MISESAGLWTAPLHRFDDLPSTNSWLLDRGHACDHGETVVAQYQTAGRGRSGRTWMCRADTGLTFSVALRRRRCGLDPEYQGAVAALALARSLEGRGVGPRLKWPNDVLVNGQKIAGILTESHSDAPDLIVVGMGVNVNQTAADFATAGLAQRAVSLAMLTGRGHSIDAMLASVLRDWEDVLDAIGRGGQAVLIDGWRQRDALRGCWLTADVAGRAVQGRALGIDADMGLRVCDAQGVVHTLRSGEVVHIEDWTPAMGDGERGD